MDNALKTGDDTLYKRLRLLQQKSEDHKKLSSTGIGKRLVEKASLEEREREKARKKFKEDERLAAIEQQTRDKEKEQRQIELVNARKAKLSVEMDLVEKRHQREDAVKQARIYQRWLQQEFPCMLWKRLDACFKTLSREERGGFKTHIGDLVKEHRFERKLLVPNLWFEDKQLTNLWGVMKDRLPAEGGYRGSYNIRCSNQFAEICQECLPSEPERRDPQGTLLSLIEKFIPGPSRIFSGWRSPTNLLIRNDFQMEKAFVYAVICLSKWLGTETLPEGLHGRWPPPMPKTAEGSQPIFFVDELGEPE